MSLQPLVPAINGDDDAAQFTGLSSIDMGTGTGDNLIVTVSGTLDLSAGRSPP